MRSAVIVIVAVGVGAGCAEREKNPNDVDAAALKPRVLHDSAGVFREDAYTIHTVENARFYLDAIDDAIKNKLRHGEPWEPHVARMLFSYARAGTTVIDAGAHIGVHTVTLSRRVGPHGRVYAFEPQKKIYRELVENLKLNGADNVVPLRFALGHENGVVIEMSPTKAGNEGGTGVSKTPDGDGDKAELRSIDSFGFSDVSLIKIDVEGFEDNVIDGARRTITASKPVIIIEIMGGHDHDHPTEKARTAIEKTKAKLVELGYVVQRFGPHDYIAMFPLR